MRRKVIFYGIIVIALLILLSVPSTIMLYPGMAVASFEKPDEVVYLNQGRGWGPMRDDVNRQTYYYTPQGTTLKGVRYSWFVNLERTLGSQRFADPDRMRAYGFVVDYDKSPANPDQLPVGFTRRFDEQSHDEMLDISCAACHTGQINVVRNGKRTAVRIDGGPAMHAFTAVKLGHFGPELMTSLIATYMNPFKFNRFAHAVLGDNYKDGKSQLRTDLRMALSGLLKQAWVDASRHLYPVDEGFGRTDALGRISNTVFGENLSEANYRTGSAPVSYPAVWDIWKYDWVQYNASVRQPMARNLGESLGVGAEFFVRDPYGRPVPPAQRYYSTSAVENLHKIEQALWELKPPAWNTQIMGPIDQASADRGKELFKLHCSHCHGPHYADRAMTDFSAPLKPNNKDEWVMATINVADIGTDPTAAMNFMEVRLDLRPAGLTAADLMKRMRGYYEAQNRRMSAYILARVNEPGPLKGDPYFNPDCSLTEVAAKQRAAQLANGAPDEVTRTLEAIDPGSVSIGAGLNFLGTFIKERYYDQMKYPEDVRQRYDGYATLDLPQVIPAYKAKPLGGAWATAPYLHNGSVPNVYSMLIPASDRPKKFFLGRRDYDLKKLGYITEPNDEDGFWFDTSIPGNHNTGHEFRKGYVMWKPGMPGQAGVIGPELKEQERWDIIEYLKIHSDELSAEPYAIPACTAPGGKY